jgi:hypothetical protein
MYLAYALARASRAVFTVLLLSSLLAPRAHADAGDFQAMPGLWKVITRSGDPVRETTAWQCVDEDADPWSSFAMSPPGAAACQREDAHRSRTSLNWHLRCADATSMHGQLAFDSPEHYVGTLAAAGGDTVLRVEGHRMAACTSPKD